MGTQAERSAAQRNGLWLGAAIFALLLLLPAPEGFTSALYPFFQQACVIGCGPDGGKEGTKRQFAAAALEYGQCDHFEKIA